MRRLLPWCVILVGCANTPSEASLAPRLGEAAADPDAFVQMVSGTEHSCGLRAAGEVWCWGDNRFGELGVELEPPHELSAAKRRVVGLESVTQLAAGARHSCALQRGAVWCWGAGWHGRLGDGRAEDSARPVRVVGIDDALAITAGDHHTCALRSVSDEIVCWGEGRSGQLGEHHLEGGSSVPVAVASGRGVVELVSTHATTCARTRGARMWCWGGWDGAPMPELRRPSGVRGVTGLSTDRHSICARGPELGRVCWDANDLEHPLEGAELRGSVDGPAQLGALARHCVVARGHAQCWRARAWSETSPLRPIDLPPGARVLSMTHGQRHACASLVSGETLCWGDNARGQLGGGWVTGASANPWADTDPDLVDDRFVCEAGQTRKGEAGVEQWCVDAAGLRHGPSVRYHPNGQLAEAGRHARGRREGTWRTWHRSGAPATTGPYLWGRRHGAWIVHAGEGGWTGSFERGAPEGSWVFRTGVGVVLRELGYEEGEPRRWVVHGSGGRPRARLEQTAAGYLATRWTETGERSESAVLVDARPDWSTAAALWQAELPRALVMQGEHRRYAPGGALVESGLHRGSLREGTWRRWYEDGSLREETDYVANHRHGRSRAWYANGQLRHEGRFVHGQQDGPWTRWYEDGKRHEQGAFAGGVRVGEHRRWYANGQLRARRDVDSGAFATWYESGRRRARGRISVMGDLEDSSSTLVGPLCAELAEGIESVGGAAGAATLPRCLGQPHGRWRLWWAKGILAADGSFHLGQPTGAWRYRDPDGARLADPCRSRALVEMFAAEGVELGCVQTPNR